ncbi:aldehyde dehydrogenase family protein, partial [Salmonella enterica subsp. enterica serovar Cerro]|nr:aldehyde dehydrogenase family protein [Salmonella enterica subsp. enterica serovar Cerro]
LNATHTEVKFDSKMMYIDALVDKETSTLVSPYGAIQAGRVWTNCYHAYPAHAAFGGYKQSGIGRETHKMMLEHYQQTKCLLVSYSDKPLGLF